MAENKKSFVLYADQKSVFDELTDEEAGLLIKHIFAYVNDENPISENRFVSISFATIKQQFKRDLIKWEAIREKRSQAGIASAEAKKSTKSTSVESVEQKPTKSTVNDTVNDTVTVNETIINNGDNAFNIFWSLYPKKFGRKDCEKIFNKLSNTDKQKIQSTLPSFIAYKPFREYTHPNPKTYLNQQRWNDEIPLTPQNIFKNGKQTIINSSEFKDIIKAIDSDGVRR